MRVRSLQEALPPRIARIEQVDLMHSRTTNHARDAGQCEAERGRPAVGLRRVRLPELITADQW